MKKKAKLKSCAEVDKSACSQERQQTISSMFLKASTRDKSVKSGSHSREISPGSRTSDAEDDVIVVEAPEETSSSYFNTKQLKDRCKRSAVGESMKLKKKSKLSLSRAYSEDAGNDSSLLEQCDADRSMKTEETSISKEQNSIHYQESKNANQASTSKSFSDALTIKMQLSQKETTGKQTLPNLTRDSSLKSTHASSSHSENTGCALEKDQCTSRGKSGDEKDSCQVPSAVASGSDLSSQATDKSSAVMENKSEVFEDSVFEGKQVFEPYYFNNFESILSSVLEDESTSQLFNEEDMATINRYKSLSDSAKKMYIRMFCRKLKWIPLDKLKYPEIGNDLQPVLDELVKASLASDEKNLTELHEAMKILSAPDVKILAKEYHIPSNITQKSQQVTELLKQTQRTNISDLFGSSRGRGRLVEAMMTRVKRFLPGVYKLLQLPRAVFVRVMMLFSVVNTSLDEDSGTGGQGQLFQMLMVNMGKVVYPDYEVEKKHSIFGSRNDVIRFAEALELEFDLLQATERGKWEEAYTVFLAVQEKQKELQADQNVVNWNKSLPVFLRSFTATSVVYRLLSQGIEILQRKKDFAGAVDLLKTLLDQKEYCCSYRGYWWERLALNFDAHLKKPEQSLEAVLSGLADSHVRVGHRLALYLRGKSICERSSLKLKHRLVECAHPPVKELPKVHIEGRVLHSSTGAGPRFLTQASYRREDDGEGMGDLAVCGVEEFVLDYYRTHGFPSGMHAEGSVVSSLFALFCWDILFLPIADAFHSPYQAMPLDLYTDSFYERRKEEIDKHMEKLAKSSVQELQAIAEESWTKHEGIACVGMNWERMRSADCIKELVGCMGPCVLSGLLTRYAKSPRHTRSGFPDLTLWNTETGAFKICEVKGPGDRLSNKQILWIDYLLGLGVDAEVCHVKAVAAKRLLPSS